MKKILFLLIFLIGSNLSFAQDFGCSWNKDNSNSIYLGNKVNKLTSGNDVLNCSKWLAKRTIKTLKGNDTINTIKSDYKGTKIELNDGDDKIIQDVEKGVMANLIIDGGPGYDKLVLNVKKEKAVIDGKCNNKCKIYIKDNWQNPHWRFKNVELRNIDEIDFSDEKIIFGKKQSNIGKNTGSNEKYNHKATNTKVKYKKINLSSYKYLIPAYWWSYKLNKKLLDLENKSSIVIINPSNGDFSSKEDVFVDEISKTHKRNNLAIGYIYTKYGKRDLKVVKSKIDNWLKCYPAIDGFFFDEVSSSSNDLDFYTKIYNYVKSKNKNLIVVLNPGTIPDKGYLNIADNVVIYENPCNTYSKYNLPSWVNNYSKHSFTFLGYACNQADYNKLSNQYKDYIYYFTNDGKDGNPWDSLSKYIISQKNNKTNKLKKTPYDIDKFKNTLSQSKLTYPDSHTKVVDKGQFQGYKSDFFYADKDNNLVFVLNKEEGDGKIRNELRQQQDGKDLGWKINENKIHILKSKVKLQKISNTNIQEYTFFQIHSEKNPLLRIVVKNTKDGLKDHIWAVLRINTNTSGKRTSRYDLGKVDNNFTSFKVEVGNNRLKIYKDNKLYLNKDISYWPETRNYFKAGIYDSKNSSAPFEIKILFNELKMSENIIDNSKNNGDSNTNNNQITLPSHNNLEVSPYTDASLYPFEELSKVYNKTKHKDYTLTFIVSKSNKCEASWGGYYNIKKGPDAWINGKHKFLYDEVKYIKEKGAKITVSFGGAAGTPLFENCNSSDLLFNEYRKIIDKLNPNEIDFDIEGSHLNKINDFDKLFKALKKVNTKYPNIKIWFTLPVMPGGLEKNGLDFVKELIKSKVKFSGINIMTMNYGENYAGNMANYAILAVKNTANQLKDIYNSFGVNISLKKAYNMIGVTPMIGVNDISVENFTLNDAKNLRIFVNKNNIGKLSYWSLNRDHPCLGDTTKEKCSSKNNQKNDYEYLLYFTGKKDFSNKKDKSSNTGSSKNKNYDYKPKYSSSKYIPPFTVKGNKIYDKNGKEVKLFGINWFGFETPNYTVHGLWSRSYLDMIKQMKKLGFNAVRLPFCPGTLHGKTPTGIDFAKNPDLKGLNSLQVFDKIINSLTSNGIYVLLDHHRPDCNAISETPEVPGYTLNDWINDLVFVAKRYKNNPYVIGIDLKNEPHGKERWGNGDIKTDWKLQVEKAANAILKVNPDILIFVEGIETNHNSYTGKGPRCESNINHWWGGNIEPIECYPLNIPANKFVLSPHVYGPSVYMQTYFKDSKFPYNMPPIWEQQIGRFIKQYPIVPDEFGGKYIGLDKIWQQKLIDWFLKKNICSFFFWSWNPNSGDTGGILKDDWTAINTDKYNNLKRLMNYCSTGKENILNTSNNTKTNTNSESKNTNLKKDNIDLEKTIDEIQSQVRKNSPINSWKEKIQNLNLIFNTSHKYLKYEKIFVKFFKEKKDKIISYEKYLNEDYYNYLNSFIYYSNMLFIDLENNNFKSINHYIGDFKKIIKKLKK